MNTALTHVRVSTAEKSKLDDLAMIGAPVQLVFALLKNDQMAPGSGRDFATVSALRQETSRTSALRRTSFTWLGAGCPT